MTNVYLTNSDEAAIVDFVKDHEELFNKTKEHFKDKAGRSVSGSSLPTVPSCLSRCARPGLTRKGHVMAS